MSRAYRVVDVLGGGAFATVAVVRLPDGTERALKVLRPSREGEVDAVARFRDEARILQRLHHPNIVRGYGLRRFGEAHLAMELEYVDGLPLDDVMHRARIRRMSPRQACELVAQAADALWAAWAVPMGDEGPMRIVHRDVRPGNLMLDARGRVKVLDFGLAHGDFEQREAVSLLDVGGSMGFLAPERKEGERGGPAVDVYALGVLLVLLMNGERMLLPLRPRRHREVADEHVARLPLTDAEPLRAMIRAMVRYDAEQRPPMDEVLAALGAHCPPGGLSLADMAEEWVTAARRGRPPSKGREHPRFAELAFVEAEAPVGESIASVPDARRKLVELLGDPTWVEQSARVAELRRAADPPIDGPLLALLDRVDPPWWRVFARATTPREAETLLHILGDRPSSSAVRRAERLTHHADERVRRAAQLVIDRGTKE